jgi:hypothetical protein
MTTPVAPTIDIEITQGSDWSQAFGVGSSTLVWKAIQGITKAGPCVISCASHGIPAGWPFWVEGVLGMREINRDHNTEEPYFATVDSSGAISINDLSSAEFGTYTSGGAICYPTPTSLAGASARMQIRSSASASTTLADLTSAGGDITLDDTLKTITPAIAAVDTAAFTWRTAEYDLELVTAAGLVIPVARGKVRVIPEVTR